METKYGYFPGCSLHSTAKEYDMSLKAVCRKLGVTLQEVDDWICCGATPAHATSEELGFALPYQNLTSAASAGLTDVLAPCAACYNRLKQTSHYVSARPEIKSRMTEITGRSLNGGITVTNILEFFRDRVGLDALKNSMNKPLAGIRIAPYYGCLLVRPSDVLGFDDPEDPQSMDEIITALGAESLPWSRKTDCCGGSLAIPEAGIVMELGRKIFSSASAVRADCIAVACPLCQSNLDMRQKPINKKYKTDFNIPVVYITQLAGLALGIDPEELGFDLLFTDAASLLEKFRRAEVPVPEYENK